MLLFGPLEHLHPALQFHSVAAQVGQIAGNRLRGGCFAGQMNQSALIGWKHMRSVDKHDAVASFRQRPGGLNRTSFVPEQHWECDQEEEGADCHALDALDESTTPRLGTDFSEGIAVSHDETPGRD